MADARTRCQPSCLYGHRSGADQPRAGGLRRVAGRYMEQLLASARDEVPATVSVTTQILHGKPTRALSALAERGCYDLVILGPRKVGWLRRLFGRSVTHGLLSRVRASVLAVRTP